MTISVWKEFKKTFKIAKKEYIIRLVNAIIIRGLLLVLPVLISLAIKDVSKGEISSALLLVLASAIVTVFYRLCECWGSHAYHALYNKIYSYYNSLGINKTNENSIFSLSRFSLGQYTNMLTTDVDIMTTFFSNNVLRFVQVLECLVIYLYIFSLNVYLFLSVIALSATILFLIPKTNKTLEKLNNKRKSTQDTQIGLIHEYFLTTKEIKSFNLFDTISKRPKNSTKEYLLANSAYIRRYDYNNHSFLLSIEIFRLLSVAYSIYLVSQGHFEIDAILILYNYYQKIIDNFSTILAINVDFTNFKVSLERFNHLIEFSKPKKYLHYTIDESVFSGKITFENILYGFRRDPILNNVSLEIMPNAITVITGKASSGKDGIANLLLKFNRQHEGNILIDNVNINDIPDEDYFKIISLVREQGVFFQDTIKNNLMLIDQDFDDIVSICKKLGIHDEISTLPNGYDTIMDGNCTLSTSAKQILAIARILLKDSRILVFDEALGILDETSQNKVLDVLQELKHNHTILLISHDKNILKEADNIILLDNKQVVESGTLKELIEGKGRYYGLFEEQTKVNEDVQA